MHFVKFDSCASPAPPAGRFSFPEQTSPGRPTDTRQKKARIARERRVARLRHSAPFDFFETNQTQSKPNQEKDPLMSKDTQRRGRLSVTGGMSRRYQGRDRLVSIPVGKALTVHLSTPDGPAMA